LFVGGVERPPVLVERSKLGFAYKAFPQSLAEPIDLSFCHIQ